VAEAETTLSWLPRREAVSRVAQHLWCRIEEVQLYIVHEEDAGRIRARRKTDDGWLMSHAVAEMRFKVVGPASPAARRESIDWDADDEELCEDDLIAGRLLRKDKATEQAPWTIPMVWSQIIRGEPWDWREWTFGMHRYLVRAKLKYSEALGADLVHIQGKPGPQGTVQQLRAGIFHALKYAGYTVAVGDHG
jgi:hypothetical protein